MGGRVGRITGGGSIIDILIYLLSVSAVLFLTLPIHEYAHARAASKLGDPTPRYTGRLTLNPLAHLDPIGTVLMVLFGFGWGKPVQVNQRYFDKPKRDMALTAAAGPLSNLLVALICLIPVNIIIGFAQPEGVLLYVALFLNYVATINIYLAVFNLIPVPPLDGSRLLTAFLPDRVYYKIMQYERYLFLAVLALIWLDVLDVPLDFLSGWAFKGIDFLASLPTRLLKLIFITPEF